MLSLLQNFTQKIFFINDLEQVDFNSVDAKIKKNTYLSLTFAFLLFGSTIVTTLGLLLENSPAVIGGMLISPLMWPLIKIAGGIANDRFSYVSKGFWLLVISILVSVLSAALITYISPIKGLNEEILARTNPTFVDLVIALVSGAVAALAITQPKMSESLAGVAIAASLMPPLCVTGIGLAVLNPLISLQSFGLFAANIVSIIFISILVFFLVGFKRTSEATHIRRGGLVFVSLVLVFMSVPLFISLVEYAIEFDTPEKINLALENRLEEISPAISLENMTYAKEFRNNQEFIVIQVDLQMPQGTVIDYRQQQALAQDLETVLDSKVDLKLILSQTASVISADDIEEERLRRSLENEFLEELEAKKPSFEVDSVQATKTNGQWNVSAILSASPELIFTHQDREDIEQALQNSISGEVELDIKIIPSIDLRSNPEIEAQQFRQEVQKTIETSFAQLSEEIEVSSIDIMEEEVSQNTTELSLEIKMPRDLDIGEAEIQSLKFNLETVFPGRQFNLQVKILEKEVLRV
jgi:uncharacterized hydrophobic protein (TIGR00271 family)